MPRNNVVQWEDPPTQSRGRRDPGKIDRQVEKLKQNPGRWAVVRKDAAAGNYITYKKRGCETRTKSLGTTENGTNRYKIYARWPEND